VFVPGVAAKPIPFGIEPAPITSDAIDPVGPVATATPVKANDAAIIEAPRTHFLRPFNMVPSSLLDFTFMTFPLFRTALSRPHPRDRRGPDDPRVVGSIFLRCALSGCRSLLSLAAP
jgi:hypothetical protein